MTKEHLMNEAISFFGHEDKRTIWFCRLCENYPETPWNLRCLENLLKALFELVIYESELEK
jgi:hypothetical protein